MKVLFYFGHPAQYLFLRASIKDLIERNVNVIILIKSKDVLEDVIKNDKFTYRNILPVERGKSRFSIFLSLIKRILRLFPLVLNEKPDIMVSTDASVAIVGMILNVNRITITEDDYNVIKTLASLTYPYTQTIICPEVCDVGKYKRKKVGYDGYMKLGYLHPSVFSPDESVLFKYDLTSKFILLRLARLTAHHDFGIKGISESVLEQIIHIATENGFRLYISSEGLLNDRFKKYQLKIDPSDMHHVLYHSSLFVSDSQSMSVEAAILGVPSIRFSSFAGRITVLEELEHRYELTFGVKPDNEELFVNMFKRLINNIESEIFEKRRNIMLKEKINVSAFMTWFISDYPKSAEIMKFNPDFQYRFR